MNISMVIFLLKLAIAIAGFGLTAFYFIPGIINKDYRKIKRGGIIFIITWVFILTITVIEFTILA